MNKDIHINDLNKTQICVNLSKRNQSYWLPSYHICPPFGLLNDPNGLVKIDNTYHIFYQWYPGGPTHGLKHWYHLSSKNLVDYDVNGLGMAPLNNDDIDGVFSGSNCTINSQSKMLYTSNRKRKEDVIQHQMIADFDGTKITNRKRIITNDRYKSHQFRDPSLFKYNNKNYIIIGAETKENTAVISLYEIKDDESTKYVCDLKPNYAKHAQMIECPQIIKLNNGLYGLISSPQGIDKNGVHFQNTFNVLVSTFTDIDLITGKFIGETAAYEIDYGHDFYAPQILVTNEELLMYAWAGCGKSKYPEQADNWMNMLTLPRQIEFSNGKLKQYVHSSVEKLIEKPKLITSDEFALNTRNFKLELLLKENTTINIGSTTDYLSIAVIDNHLVLDRSNCQHKVTSLHGDVRYCPLLERNDQQVQIYVDNSIVEVFLNNNETTMTSRFFVEDLKMIKANTNYQFSKMRAINLKYKGEHFE